MLQAKQSRREGEWPHCKMAERTGNLATQPSSKSPSAPKMSSSSVMWTGFQNMALDPLLREKTGITAGSLGRREKVSIYSSQKGGEQEE